MSSGMVRKVDELGRVVIPKEMRRVLGIKTGSSIEMDVDSDGNIILKKFSEMSNMFSFAEKLADEIYTNYKYPLALCDEEKIIIVRGLKKELIGNILNKGFPILCCTLSKKVLPVDFCQKTHQYVYVFPIKSNGYVNGYLLLFSDSETFDYIKEISSLVSFLGSLLIE